MYNQAAAAARTSQTKTPPTTPSAKEAFLEAVERFSTWSAGETEPTVSFEDYDITLTAAAHLVATCQSSIPRSCADTLKFCDVELQTKTYAGAANALLQAIKKMRQTH
jgi:hypothetical protein